DVAEHLLQRVRINWPLVDTGSDFFDDPDQPAAAGARQVLPGFSPDCGEVAGFATDADRCRVTADFFVEVMQMFLRALNPPDEVHGIGLFLELFGEHVQACLTALQGVPAFMSET